MEKFVKENQDLEETTTGYLPNVQKLQIDWRQKAQENVQEIQGLTKLNWDYYSAYLVKPHSLWMTLKCIINSTEKMVPDLADFVFLAQLKSEVSQPTLLK